MFLFLLGKFLCRSVCFCGVLTQCVCCNGVEEHEVGAVLCRCGEEEGLVDMVMVISMLSLVVMMTLKCNGLLKWWTQDWCLLRSVCGTAAPSQGSQAAHSPETLSQSLPGILIGWLWFCSLSWQWSIFLYKGYF